VGALQAGAASCQIVSVQRRIEASHDHATAELLDLSAQPGGQGDAARSQPDQNQRTALAVPLENLVAEAPNGPAHVVGAHDHALRSGRAHSPSVRGAQKDLRTSPGRRSQGSRTYSIRAPFRPRGTGLKVAPAGDPLVTSSEKKCSTRWKAPPRR